jgi:uncharacterized phage-associated protein
VPIDPRSIANLILAIRTKPTTNLGLQKLLYFVHGAHLIRTKMPLVSGYFEAWQHGPVHTAVYNAFKNYGPRPIASPATRKSIRTGTVETVPLPDDDFVMKLVRSTVFSLDDLTAGQLVTMSHAHDGPWHVVSKRAQHEAMLGLRISNDLILERFKFHHLSACQLSNVEEPGEDSPIAYHRLG